MVTNINFAKQKTQTNYERFIQIAEKNDWNVHASIYERNVCLECEKYSPANQDFIMTLHLSLDGDEKFCDLVQNYIEVFDPHYEADIWSVGTGEYDDEGNEIREGANGAPTDYADIVADMECCLQFMQDLEKELRSVETDN